MTGWGRLPGRYACRTQHESRATYHILHLARHRIERHRRGPTRQTGIRRPRRQSRGDRPGIRIGLPHGEDHVMGNARSIRDLHGLVHHGVDRSIPVQNPVQVDLMPWT